jgi:hypothetical protein
VQDSRKDAIKDLKQRKRPEKKSAYQTPVVTDYGDVARLTQGGAGTKQDGQAGSGTPKQPFL